MTAVPATLRRRHAGGATRLLVRKARRDLWHWRGQMLAIMLVIAVGVATYVSLRGMADYLGASQQAYYAQSRFADAFASMTRAPRDVETIIRRIPGVASVEGRIVRDVTVRVPNLAEPATAHIVTVPDNREPAINDVLVLSGRRPDPAVRGEVLASEPFMNANGLRSGDRITAVLNGRLQTLTIVGMGASAEFVYELPSTGAVFPDSKHYGVVWAPYGWVADAFDMQGSISDLVVTYAPGAEERAILPAMDEVLAPYGCRGSYGRDEQPSHRFVSDEIRQNRVAALIVPVIFLGVAAYLLSLTLGRLVNLQREQLGTLKAFGFTSGEMLRHVLTMSLMPTVAGIVVGTGVGIWLAQYFADIYADFYRFPSAVYRPSPSTLWLGGAIALVSAVVGGWRAAMRVARLEPAEAMRPEPPPRFRRGLVERAPFIQRARVSARLVVRGLERRPVRTAGAVFGLSMAVAVGVVGRYTFDAIHVLSERQFALAQREDVEVTFERPVPLSTVYALRAVPTVTYVEPVRTVPVRITRSPRRDRLAMFGLRPDASMRRVIDSDGSPRSIPTAGLMMSSVLAERLGVVPGDSVQIELLDGLREVRPAVLTRTVEDLLGLSAWMSLEAMNEWLGEEPVATSALLRTDGSSLATVYDALNAMPLVQGVTVRSATIDAFNETVAGSFGIINTIFTLFATAIAVGIVYNGARLSLSERGRELASLRVLGFTPAEVGRILTGEQAVLVMLAIPFGAVLGVLFSWYLGRAIAEDLFRLPLVVSPSTILLSVMIVMGVAALSAWRVYRRVHTLDLVRVLKTWE